MMDETVIFRYPCMHKLFVFRTLGRYLVQSHLSCKLFVFPIQTPLQNLDRILSVMTVLPKTPTFLVFIFEGATRRQADGRHVANMVDCFRKERSVKLDEGNIIVASIQKLRLVSLMNDNLLNAPGTN